jgi:hypothetical protein
MSHPLTSTEYHREQGRKRMKEGRSWRRYLRKVRARTSDPALRDSLRESLHGRLLREAFAGKDAQCRPRC